MQRKVERLNVKVVKNKCVPIKRWHLHSSYYKGHQQCSNIHWLSPHHLYQKKSPCSSGEGRDWTCFQTYVIFPQYPVRRRKVQILQVDKEGEGSCVQKAVASRSGRWNSRSVQWCPDTTRSGLPQWSLPDKLFCNSDRLNAHRLRSATKPMWLRTCTNHLGVWFVSNPAELMEPLQEYLGLNEQGVPMVFGQVSRQLRGLCFWHCFSCKGLHSP